jgi:hypothetical protein
MTDHSQLRRFPPRQPSPRQDDEQDDEALLADDDWPPRTHTSAIRYQTTTHGASADTALVRTTTTTGQRIQGVPARRSALTPRRADAGHVWPPPVQREREPSLPPPRQPGGRYRFHWSVFVGLGMFIIILGWVALGALGSWWQTTQDDWHYGRPRTFQLDAVVGHNNDSAANPSHFIALNLSRRIEIIELPAGDPSKARIYSGPTMFGQGQDLVPVTLSFRDINGDGRPDMLVWVADSHFVFMNDQGGFRPARPGEELTGSS